jgi:hypothetical protein
MIRNDKLCKFAGIKRWPVAWDMHGKADLEYPDLRKRYALSKLFMLLGKIEKLAEENGHTIILEKDNINVSTGRFSFKKKAWKYESKSHISFQRAIYNLCAWYFEKHVINSKAKKVFSENITMFD